MSGRPNFTDGYIAGQHDALTWLSVDAMPGDHPFAPLEERVWLRASLVCLAANLATAGGLCAAFRNGCDADALLAGCPCDACVAAVWRPGCGRPAGRPSCS